jgi:hypothetical protein
VANTWGNINTSVFRAAGRLGFWRHMLLVHLGGNSARSEEHHIDHQLRDVVVAQAKIGTR